MQVLSPYFCRLVKLENALKILQSLEKDQSVFKVRMGFTEVGLVYILTLFAAIDFQIISPIVRWFVKNAIQTRCYSDLVTPIRSCLFKGLRLTNYYSRVIYVEQLAVVFTYTLCFRQILFGLVLL